MSRLRPLCCVVLLGLAALLPAAAQELPRLAEPASSEARLIPFWNSASGRFEAMLLVDGDELQPRSTIDRVIASERRSIGLGAGMRTAGDSLLRADLRIDPQSGGLALLCDSGVGLSSTLAGLADHCLLAALGAEDLQLPGRSGEARMGLNWQSGRYGLDFSYGLGWLRTGNELPLQLDRHPLLLPTVDTPWLLGSGLELQSDSLALQGQLNFDGGPWLTLGSSVSRVRLHGYGATVLPQGGWNESALRLGVGYGRLSGELIGRNIDAGDASWSGLDLGVTWRFPWQGRVTFGAKNLLSSGDTSQWPLADLPADESPARTPYVRYHQDL